MEPTNRTRQTAGIFYLIGGVILMVSWSSMRWPHLIQWLSKIPASLLWCAAMSAIGIGAGLINTRKHDKTKLDHGLKHYYVLYYPFALLIVFLASLTTALLFGENLNAPTPKFYTITSLSSLILGLLAENFGVLTNWVLKRLK